MIVPKTPLAIIPDGWLHASNVVVCCFLLSGVLTAQDPQNNVSTRLPQLSVSPGLPGQMRLSQFGGVKVIDQGPPDTIRGIGMTVAVSSSPTASAGPRLITLQEAQQKAAPADSNPMVRLGQLQVEVARQTRLGTQSSFFPQIGSAFDNLHFNKFMGEQLQVRRPIQGGTATIAVPLVGKDQTFVAVTATQPITPLFQLRELYKINLADERIARAKAGMPISETANKVEKAYYELLVAQRQLAFTASMAALFFESAKR